MNADQLDAYIAALLTPESMEMFGAAYVRRQVEWAEFELQKRLTEKSSSMPEAPQILSAGVCAEDPQGAWAS